MTRFIPFKDINVTSAVRATGLSLLTAFCLALTNLDGLIQVRQVDVCRNSLQSTVTLAIVDCIQLMPITPFFQHNIQ